jgi:hypothetical protein
MDPAARKAWLTNYRRAGLEEFLVADVRVIDVE